MPYLEVQDCKLFYQIDDHTDPWTSPETVLFVHGFTESTEAWRAWVPHFSRGYRVGRIAQRGFGRGKPIPVAPSPVTPPNAAGWIEEMERTSVRSWARRTQRERMGSQMPEAGTPEWAGPLG